MKLSIIPSEQCPHHELEVQDWFAKKEEFYNQFKSQVVLLRATEKAIQIKLVNSFKNNPDRYNAEQQEIIRLSAEGKSIREIRATVPGSTEKVCAALARGRRLENVNNL